MTALPRAGGIHKGVVALRVGDQAGKQGRFADRHRRERRHRREDGVAREEEPLHRRFDAVRALPEVHGVEVLLEDLLLRVLLVQTHRQDDFLDLAVDVALGGEDPVLDELLGDRRAALLDRSRREVLECGTKDTVEVDAVVGPERLVLDRDHRVLDDLGHVLELDVLTVLEPELRDHAELRVVDRRTLGERLEVAELVARVVVAGHERCRAGDERGQAGAEGDAADHDRQQHGADGSGDGTHGGSPGWHTGTAPLRQARVPVTGRQ